MPQHLADVDRLWRAANYLSVGQIYLWNNPLLRRPLEADDVKPRLLGHWGTTPGLNFVYAHLQRAVVHHDLPVMFVAGPGHGGPAVVANTWLEGSYPDVAPDLSLDEAGMRRLFTRFSFPRGIPSHVAPEVPGSIHEGGELGYSLAHAAGAAMDDPDLVVACVVGDGEAESGPLAASWHTSAFLHPRRDGAVLPILHLNGYKIANPTVLGRRSDEDLVAGFRADGWEPIVVEAGDDHELSHRRFADALDRCVETIRVRRGSDGVEPPRAPMIVLRSPKGWTGPDEVDDQQIEGTWRSHQVPLSGVRTDPDHRAQLERWLRSYRPEELFDAEGRPRDEVVGWLPRGDRRIGSIPAANGGTRLRPLDLPDHRDHGPDVEHPATTRSEPTRLLGRMLRDVFRRNEAASNFRLFGPDETESNRLDAVYDATDDAWQLERLESDRHLAPTGRVMEVLSEHLCQGWLEGYLLTGRHGLFATYEGFVPIVDSMFNQHLKRLRRQRELPWRAPIAPLNYLLTSHVWRQDHNGYSHQDPGFLDQVTSKGSDQVNVYLPPDANSLLAAAARCLSGRDEINVIVSGKHPTLDVLSPEQADRHVERGAGIWGWASTDGGDDPHVVLACAGDVPTQEVLAAASILRDRLPELRVRVVNVVSLMSLADARAHPHGLSDEDDAAVFGVGVPVVFAFHGYPWLIERITHHRRNRRTIHARGYLEAGSTTTPFDMVVRNRVDRYQLAIDAIDRARDGSWRHGSSLLRQELGDVRRRHVDHLIATGEDLPEVRDWSWVA